MSIHLNALGASKQLVDRFLGLPVMLLQNELCKVRPQALDTALERDQVKASFFLLSVEHGADLEDLISQAHLIKITIHKLATSCVAALAKRLLKQLFSEVLSLLNSLVEFSDLSLLFTVQIVEEREGNLNCTLRIVELIDNPFQLLMVGKVFAQICLHRLNLKLNLRHALALGLRVSAGLANGRSERRSLCAEFFHGLLNLTHVFLLLIQGLFDLQRSLVCLFLPWKCPHCLFVERVR